MSATTLEPKDIIASKAKWGDQPIMKIDPNKARKNKNPSQPTYYIPVLIRNVAGNFVPVNLKFAKQLIASSAKVPHGTSDDDAKDVRISFRLLKDEDLEGTEYEESKRSGLLSSNAEFIEAMSIIADEYVALVEREVFTYKGEKFKIIRPAGAKKDTPVAINCFRQVNRKLADGEKGANEDDDFIALPTPIYRIKIPADIESRKIGFSTEKGGFTPVVFDLKRMLSEKTKPGAKRKPVVARIKTADGYQDLTISNAKHFITYMSVTGGTIAFDSVCISKSGVSLMCRVRELFVIRHKPMKMESLTDGDIDEMGQYNTNSNEEEEIINLDEPTEDADEKPKNNKGGKPAAKKPPAKNNKNAKAVSKALDEDGEVELNDVPDEDDAEPAENDAEEPVEEPATPKKAPAKPDAKPADKKKPKKAASDDEPDENDDEPKSKPVSPKANNDAVDEPDEDAEDEDTPKPKAKPVAKPAAKKVTTGGNLKAAPKK